MDQRSNEIDLSLQSPFSVIPSSVLDSVLTCLDLVERTICYTVTSTWQSSCKSVDGQITTLCLRGPNNVLKGPSAHLSRFTNLRVLDLMYLAEDWLVTQVARLLPHLSSLLCTYSPKLTDTGLVNLAAESGAESVLREIDLTFCYRTTYGASIQLRHDLPLLTMIRRQPPWMDGHFITPFGGSTVEAHTYFADATFDFSRESQSRGYVRLLQEHPDGFFTDSLQYSNFGDQMRMPPFCKYLYRPGVALRPVPDLDAPGPSGAVRNILVAQAMSGCRAPQVWPPIPDEDVFVGASVYVTADGTLLQDEMSIEAARENGAVSMVSRMEVLPLTSLMPPLSLVNEIQDFEREREQWESGVDPLVLEHLEDTLQLQ